MRPITDLIGRLRDDSRSAGRSDRSTCEDALRGWFAARNLVVTTEQAAEEPIDLTGEASAFIHVVA